MELSCFWDSELWATGFGAPGLGRRVWGAGFGAPGLGAGFGAPGLGRRVWGRRVWGGAACPCGARCAPPPPGVNVLDLLFSRRRVPFCRKRLFRTEKRATVPCVRCLALWARDAAGVRGRRCLPCGQRRCRVARRILACRGKSRVSVRFTHQEIFPARRGGGGKRASPRKERSFSRTPSALRSPNEPFPTRNGDTPHLTDETRPLLLQNLPRLSIRSKRGPLQVAPHRPLISRRTSIAPQAQLSAPAKSQLSTLPAAVSSPYHPAGGTAGSARTRSRVQTLENPFWGAAAVSPHPRPPTPQAASPCSWTCRRVCALPPEQKRNEASPPPARGADLRDPRANGTGRRHCRPS